jgi:GNAT superfamily N-acetyltransferase
VNLRTMRGLVAEGRSHGVLVYDHGAPVGWCQLVPRDQLRKTDIAASGADWYITCFVVEPRYRGLGVSSTALRAAVKAIAGKGGGVVEGHATAWAPGPAPTADRKDLHVDGDVLFWGGTAKVRYGVEVEGAGPVAALYRSKRSMHGAPLGGTVDLYRREGFAAVGVAPRPKTALADRIVMRRSV